MNSKFIPIIFQIHSYCIPNLFLLCSKFVPIVFQVHSYCIPNSFILCSKFIPIVFQVHSYCIPNSFLLCSKFIPIVFQVHSYCIPNSFLLCSKFIAIVLKIHSYCIPNSFLLYSKYFLFIKNFKIKNKENKISHGRGNSLKNKYLLLCSKFIPIVFRIHSYCAPNSFLSPHDCSVRQFGMKTNSFSRRLHLTGSSPIFLRQIKLADKRHRQGEFKGPLILTSAALRRALTMLVQII